MAVTDITLYHKFLSGVSKMKVSWELVSPLSPGSYIYPPVTWYGSHIGQVSARPPLIGRQLAWLETVTTEPVAWRDSLARREDWRTGGQLESVMAMLAAGWRRFLVPAGCRRPAWLWCCRSLELIINRLLPPHQAQVSSVSRPETETIC